MTAPYLPGRLSPSAKEFLVDIAATWGERWALTFAHLFIDGMQGGAATHIAREGQESIEGEPVYLWRPTGDPAEQYQRFEGRRQ